MYVCKETGFDLALSVDGKVKFNPDNLPLPENARVPAAPCPQGYLIGWVTDDSHRPIKYDGLIGDAILRDRSGAIETYDAIQIRAEPNLATRAGIASGIDPRTGAPTLVFDGAAGSCAGSGYGSHRVAGTGKRDRLPEIRKGDGNRRRPDDCPN